MSQLTSPKTFPSSSASFGKVFGMGPLDYFDFVANSEWEKLSDFINFYPDITHVVDTNSIKTVEHHIDAIKKITPNAKLGYGLLQIVCLSASRIPESTAVIKSIFDRNQISINYAKDNGFTALMISVRNSSTSSNIETVQLLIESGANLDLQNSEGCTALMISSQFSCDESSIETVQLLIESGADLEMRNRNGWTALMLAVRASGTTSNLGTVLLLIESGANLDAQSVYGLTPLMIASSGWPFDASKTEIVLLLIESGAKLDLMDMSEKTFINFFHTHEHEGYKRVIKHVFSLAEEGRRNRTELETQEVCTKFPFEIPLFCKSGTSRSKKGVKMMVKTTYEKIEQSDEEEWVSDYE